MSVRRAAAALAVAVSVLVLFPARGLGQGSWPWPVGSEVSLAYGAAYTGADGKTCTHSGIDIPADEGTTVRACATGHVTFAGPVPSGEGARSLAVTLLTADGLKVTFLPLASTSVAVGDDVSSGEAVGMLAATGDASTARSHLHLSVRRGDCHIDPASLLAAPLAVQPVDVAPDGPPPAPESPTPAEPDAPAVVSNPAQDVAPGAPDVASLESRAARPVASACASGLKVATTATMRHAVASGTRALGAVPRFAPLARPAVPPLVRLGDALSAIARARTGAAWWIVRMMIATAAVACVLPLLRSVRPAGVVADATAAERARA